MIFKKIRNLKYVTADNSFIDLFATCEEYGEIPMTLNLVDTEDLHVFATGKFEVVLEKQIVLEKKIILEDEIEKEIEVSIKKEVEVQKEIFIPLEEYCKTLKIAPYVVPEIIIVIPESITRLQAKLQLSKIGKFSEAEALIQENEKARIYWNDANNFLRTDEILKGMATALGLSDAQLDDLFLQASKL